MSSTNGTTTSAGRLDTCPAWCERNHIIEAHDFEDELVWHTRKLATVGDDDFVQLAVDDNDLDTPDDVSIWIGGNRLEFSEGRRLHADDLRTWALMLANAADALEAVQRP